MFGSRNALYSQIRLLGSVARPTIRASHRLLARNATFAAYPNAATPPPPKRSPWLRRLIYAGIFGGMGMVVGKNIEDKVAAPPAPGSELDSFVMAELRQVYDKAIPIVQELRSNPDFEEQDVYGNYAGDEKEHRLTSGPLRGSRGVALQKVFWNKKDREAISIVCLGEGLEGWPTIVHGGALGTILDENLGRTAVRSFPEKTGVTANLDINYRAPVYSGHFYTFHSSLDRQRSTDRKAYVKGEVRDPFGGLCVEAKGLFVVPKKYKLQNLGEEY